MNQTEQVYAILKDVVNNYALNDLSINPLPDIMMPESKLSDHGLDLTNLPEIGTELKSRFGGKYLQLDQLYPPDELNQSTISQFVELLVSSLASLPNRSLVVYVDDEEENLFVFSRKFGKTLNLKTFTDPIEALSFIKSNENVSVVITDEVMPKMSGNILCDEVHKTKPNLKFILITGNPDNDGNLMYNSLKQNRFYEFINKPVDFEGKGEDYLNMILGIIHFSW